MLLLQFFTTPLTILAFAFCVALYDDYSALKRGQQ